MQIISKFFNELNTKELYELLQLRSEVFVIEQNCIYPDLDSKDYMAYHILGYKQNELVAYCRVFKAGDYFSNSSIGRFLVKSTFRNKRLAHHLIKASLLFIKNNFSENTIEISAQVYLSKFYGQYNFIKVGDAYLEDGIPHIKMILNL